MLISVASILILASTCSNEEREPCFCSTDSDCQEGHICNDCYCYPDESCARDEDCLWGTCLECVDHHCVSFACESDEECYTEDANRWCGDYDSEIGCRRCEYDGCITDEICKDPGYPLYIECQDDERPKCFTGVCQCRPPCGGSCPDGQYCCQQTQTCDPIPDPCQGVECPPGEKVNPDPGGTLNEEICKVEGADCSCVPGP
jgi:hypothetical protein